MTFNTISLVFLALALIWFLWNSWKPSWDLFSPGRLYNIVWFGAIGITCLNWSDLQTEWTGEFWFFLLVSILAFQSGVALVRARAPKGQLQNRPKAPNHRPSQFYTDPDRFLKYLGLVLLVATAGYALQAYLSGGIPVLSENPEEARVRFYGLFWGPLEKVSFLMASLFSLVIPLGALFFLTARNSTARQRIAVGLAVIASVVVSQVLKVL